MVGDLPIVQIQRLATAGAGATAPFVQLREELAERHSVRLAGM